MNKTLWRITLLAGLLVSGLLACTQAPAADPERATLAAAIQRWTAAVNSQDVAALTATMTEDVELLDDEATVRGRDSAIRALHELVSRGKLSAVSSEITIAGDVAWHVTGLAQTQQNGVVRGSGQALEIWKREKGTWRLHRRMTAGAVSPEISLTRPSTKEPVLERPKN